MMNTNERAGNAVLLDEALESAVSTRAAQDIGTLPESYDRTLPRLPHRKLRVLQIITVFGTGGATNVVLEIADHFTNHSDFEMEVLCGPIIAGRTDLLPVAESRGITTRVVPSLVNHVRPLRNAKSVADIQRVLRDGRYDIVHTHTSVAGVVGRLAARAAGTPRIVHHVHGWGLHDEQPAPMRMLRIGLERLCARFTDRIITVSRPDHDKGHNYGIAGKEKLRLIYNGIQVDRFRQTVDEQQVRSSLGLDPESKLVGMIGRLDKQKNPLDFIKAAAIVAQQLSGVQFLIVGDGPLHAQSERLIDALGLRGKVFLLGFRDDVSRILPVLTLTAMSSLWEGLPLAFVESMSAGKPIVANDVDGASDVVVDGETGFLVTPRQPGEMAERILLLLKDGQLCRQMGQIGQQRALRFSRERAMRQIEGLYRELYI